MLVGISKLQVSVSSFLLLSTSVCASNINLAALTPSQGYAITNSNANSFTGISISSIGDLNGDRIPEILIGASKTNSNQGAGYVVYGNRTGVDLATLTSTQGYKIIDTNSGGNAGLSISAAGDINKDGLPDILISAYSTSPGGVGYVVYGGQQGVNLATIKASQGYGIIHSSQNAFAGYSMSSSGDLNGDGIPDILIGAYGVNSGRGAGYVVYGGQRGVDLASITPTQGYAITNTNTQAQTGFSISSFDDINDDGIPEILIGAPGTNNYQGAAYVVYGGQTGVNVASLTPTQGYAITNTNTNAYTGISVSSTGDINGDGVPDILIGAYGANSDQGAGYVVYGRQQGVNLASITSAQGYVIANSNAEALTGKSIRSIGDLNRDGIPEILIGAYGTNNNQGSGYVVYGGQQGVNLASLTPSQGYALTTTISSGSAGYAMSSVADLNGDGVPEVLIGAYRTNGDQGIGYVVYGQQTGPSGTLSISHTPTSSRTPSKTPSTSLSNSASISLSGSQSISVSPSASPGYYAPIIDLATLTSAQGVIIDGAATGDEAGWSVNQAGDVNGDGIGDVIIGAPYSNPIGSRTNGGAAYVIYGTKGDSSGPIDLSTFSTSNPQGFVIEGAASGNSAGWSVSQAGDINGDGIGDIIVGAPYANPTRSRQNSGAAYVIYGKNTTQNGPLAPIDLNTFPTSGSSQAPSNSLGFVIQGAAANNLAGLFVSQAGDVNGDGIGDIIVGAPYANPTGSRQSSGAAYVIYGKNTTQNGPFAPIDLNTFPTSGSSQAPSNTQGFVIQGAAAFDNAGTSVSLTSDVNGDEIEDIIVGAPFANPTGNRAQGGAAYVIYGKNTTKNGRFAPIDLNTFVTSNSQGFIIQGAVTGDLAGYSVNQAGDINSDGIIDLIVGASNANPTQDRPGGGAAYVIYGQNTTKNGPFTNIDLNTFTTSNTQGFVIIGSATYDNASYSVTQANDVNGDGIGDIMVGAYRANPTVSRQNGGATYVIYGQNTTKSGPFTNIDLKKLTSMQGLVLAGAGNYNYAGCSVSQVGDFNGDGFDDVVIGAYGADPTNSRSFGGAAYVVYGIKSTLMSSSLTSSTSQSSSISLTSSLSVTSSLSESASLSLTPSVSVSDSSSLASTSVASQSSSRHQSQKPVVTGKVIYPSASKSKRLGKRMSEQDVVPVASSQGERAQSWLSIKGWGQVLKSWWRGEDIASQAQRLMSQRYTLTDYVEDCQRAQARPSTHQAFRTWLASQQAQGHMSFERDFERDYKAGFQLSLTDMPAEVIAHQLTQRLKDTDDISQDRTLSQRQEIWTDATDQFVSPAQVWRPTLSSAIEGRIDQ